VTTRRLLLLSCWLCLTVAVRAFEPAHELRAIVSGDTRGVIARLRAALQDERVIGDTLLHARTLEMLGEQYYQLSDIDEAKRLWDRAYALRQRKFGEASAEMAVGWAWRTRYHNYMGAPQWDHQAAAEETAVRAVELLRHTGELSPRERVLVLRERAYAYKIYHGHYGPDRGENSPQDPASASRPLFRKALRAAVLARDTIWIAQVLHDIGNTFTDNAFTTQLLNDPEALRIVVDSGSWYYGRSTELMVKMGLTASQPVMMDHLCLGLLYNYAYGRSGRKRATTSFQRALRVFQAMHGVPATSDLYGFHPAITNKAQVIELLSFIGTNMSDLWLNERRSRYLDSALLVMDAATLYWEAMLKEYDSKKLHLVTSSYAHNPFEHGMFSLVARYRQSMHKEDMYKLVVGLERRRSSRVERDRLRKGLPAVEWLEEGARERMKAPPGTLVLLFFQADGWQVIAVDEDGPQLVELSGLPIDISFSVGEFKELEVRKIGRDPLAFRRSAYQLYQGLLEPVLAGRKEKRLVIVPIGTMTHLPFEALLVDTSTASNDHFLMGRYEIRYAPDLSTALAGTVETGRDLTVALAQPTGSSALPFAERSARLLASRAGTPLVNNVTTLDLDHLVQEQGVLHVASHAHSEMQPDGNFYLLTQDGRWTPMAGDSGRFHRDLVVLASCSSGSGRVFRSEGAKTIGNSLLEGGVGCVVHTLWPVDDRATSEILDHMYDGLLAGLPVSRALHEAKLRFIADHHHDGLADPYYWSGIVVLGRDVMLERAEPDPRLLLLLLPVALAGIYSLRRSRSRSARSRT
jgi:hypothetical protein